MKTKILTLAFSLFIVAFSANLANGQGGPFYVAPEVGLRLDGTDLLLGVNATKDFNVSDYSITGNGAFDYYLIDNVTYWVFELAALYNLSEQESFSPYVGGGLGFWNWSFDNDILDGLGDFNSSGTTLLAKGGANFAPIGSMVPFAEATFHFDGSDFILKGGVRFPFGGE